MVDGNSRLCAKGPKRAIKTGCAPAAGPFTHSNYMSSLYSQLLLVRLHHLLQRDPAPDYQRRPLGLHQLLFLEL